MPCCSAAGKLKFWFTFDCCALCFWHELKERKSSCLIFLPDVIAYFFICEVKANYFCYFPFVTARMPKTMNSLHLPNHVTIKTHITALAYGLTVTKSLDIIRRNLTLCGDEGLSKSFFGEYFIKAGRTNLACSSIILSELFRRPKSFLNIQISMIIFCPLA